MPYFYQYFYELYDEQNDRFWYTDVTVQADEPLSRRAQRRAVDALVAQKIAESQYESLRDWLEENSAVPAYTLQAVFLD